MFVKFRWEYDGTRHESSEMFLPTVSEIHEQASYIYNRQDKCPLWVVILDDDGGEFAILPL